MWVVMVGVLTVSVALREECVGREALLSLDDNILLNSVFEIFGETELFDSGVYV